MDCGSQWKWKCIAKCKSSCKKDEQTNRTKLRWFYVDVQLCKQMWYKWEDICYARSRQYVCLHLLKWNICGVASEQTSLFCIGHLYAQEFRWVSLEKKYSSCTKKNRNAHNKQYIFHVVHLNRHSFCSSSKEIMISRA